MTAPLVFLALAIGLLGLRELSRDWASVARWLSVSGVRFGRHVLGAPRFGRARELAGGLGLSRRIARAGYSDRLATAHLLAIKALALFVLGLLPLPLLGSMAGGRFGLLLIVFLPLGAFLLPDLLLEVIAVRRMRAIGSALPDLLDLAATKTSTGSAPVAALSAAAPQSGPLASEVRVLTAEAECGVPTSESLTAFNDRVPLQAVAAVCATVERSRTLGSPLADHLRHQAGRLRSLERRRIAEQGARAAPKIQLVVALLLVPSVLLMIAAGLLANLGELVSGF